MVRPWKERFRVRMVLRPLPYLSKLYFRASFDHGLIGLGPGVAEKDLVHSAAGAQLLGQQGPGLGIKQIGDMPQLPNLLCNGGHPLGVAISQGINPDAAGKVDVFPP